jgi:hypothetical protein
MRLWRLGRVAVAARGYASAQVIATDEISNNLCVPCLCVRIDAAAQPLIGRLSNVLGCEAGTSSDPRIPS